MDKEVGYCQGISFVAGVLLLHMSEEQAFEMLKFLMYDLGFRKQYRPDMMSLQVRRPQFFQRLGENLYCFYIWLLICGLYPVMLRGYSWSTLRN